MRHFLLDASVLVDFVSRSGEAKALRVRRSFAKLCVCRKSRPALPAAVYAEDPIPDGWGAP